MSRLRSRKQWEALRSFYDDNMHLVENNHLTHDLALVLKDGDYHIALYKGKLRYNEWHYFIVPHEDVKRFIHPPSTTIIPKNQIIIIDKKRRDSEYGDDEYKFSAFYVPLEEIVAALDEFNSDAFFMEEIIENEFNSDAFSGEKHKPGYLEIFDWLFGIFDIKI